MRPFVPLAVAERSGDGYISRLRTGKTRGILLADDVMVGNKGAPASATAR